MNLPLDYESARVIQDRPEDRLPIRFLRAVDVIYSRVYHNVRVINPCHLPKRGHAILVCNHISGLDPVLIQSVCNRLVVWMMAKEYYEIKWLRWVFKTVEAIPVQRSGRDMTATRAALRALQQNRVLGVFPEGRIEDDGKLLEFQTGVALLAIRTGAQVIPAGLAGTQQGMEMTEAFTYPQKAVLSFGTPVQFGRNDISRDALEAATSRIREAVANLRTESLSNFARGER
jgi:1-acyl-sn-glycerol-3-phosphate acyltransferase